MSDHVEDSVGKDSNHKSSTQKFISVTFPCEMKVSDNLKKRIWSKKYIDLSTLTQPVDDPDFDVKFSSNSQGGQVNWNKSKVHKPITNIAQWCNAMETYIAVYCKRYSDEIAQLMTYMGKIKSLAQRGGNWLRCDEQFRIKRATMDLPWDQLVMEIWVECLPVSGKMTNISKNQSRFNNSNNYNSNNI